MTSSAAGSPTPRSPRRIHRVHLERRARQITARLIVRRVRDLNKQAAAGPGRAVPRLALPRRFTDSPFELVQAEEQHRDHASVEQVFADLDRRPARAPALRVLPRERGLAGLAAIAHNLLRAAGSLASLAYAKARGATIRRDLIDVAARTARHGRGHITLHLPEAWHREHEWMNLFDSRLRAAPQRPDQPRPVTALHAPPGPPPPPAPSQEPGQAAGTVSGRKTMLGTTALNQKTGNSGIRSQPVDRGLVAARRTSDIEEDCLALPCR